VECQRGAVDDDERFRTRPGGELGRLLQEAGSAYDAQSVEALIEGVLAAPAEIGTSWHMLGCRPGDSALAGALEALRAAKAKVYRNGLSAEDFKLMPSATRLDRLRRELAAQDLDGFIVPRADEHQGEYVPPRGQRLAWLTGFTGSAGLARSCWAIARRSSSMGATLCRQQRKSTPRSFEIHHLIEEPAGALGWYGHSSQARCSVTTLGCTTPHEVERFSDCDRKGWRLVCARPPKPHSIRVWLGHPPPPIAPVVPHPERFAGESAQSKRARPRTRIGRGKAPSPWC